MKNEGQNDILLAFIDFFEGVNGPFLGGIRWEKIKTITET